jgi:hypothetical protein
MPLHSKYNGFIATRGFIATWDKVKSAYPGVHGDGIFQALLLTDGLVSIVALVYDKLTFAGHTLGPMPKADSGISDVQTSNNNFQSMEIDKFGELVTSNRDTPVQGVHLFRVDGGCKYNY